MNEPNDETIDSWLGEQLESADNARRESNRLAPNSYGAGYDQGRYDAFRDALTKLLELWSVDLGPLHSPGTADQVGVPRAEE